MGTTEVKDKDPDITAAAIKTLLTPTAWLSSAVLAAHRVVLMNQLKRDGIGDVVVVDPYAWDEFSAAKKTAEEVGSKFGKHINFDQVKFVIFIAHVHGNHWVFYVWNIICD